MNTTTVSVLTRINKIMSQSIYVHQVRDMLSPFYEAALLAKQLGNISFKKLKLDVKTLVSVLKDDIEDIVDKEVSSDPKKIKREEIQKIVQEITRVVREQVH